jgi:hypothetical protein
MRDHDPAYVATLARQLRGAEDELQELRSFKTTVTTHLRNTSIALDIRQGLARDLRLPTPEK